MQLAPHAMGVAIQETQVCPLEVPIKALPL